MDKLITILILCLISGRGITSAREAKKWTLQDCINHAVENNIGLKRQVLQTESGETDYLKARMNLFPSVNIGSDLQVGFGRSIDPVTNLITFEQNLSNSYSLSSSVTIFSGFTLLNTVSANRFMLKAGMETEKVIRNTIVVNILGAYYQVLYAKGLEDAAKMQLDLTEKQLFRITRMVETGKEALSKKYEMESRASEDRLSYTISRNNTNQAVTSLKQLLQLEPGTEFEILIPDLDNEFITDTRYDIDSVYNIASQALPRLKAINYELMASKKQLAAARGNLAPKLSAGGVAYTGYYKLISEGVPEQDSFSRQLKNNNSQAIYFSLNIPIFNNYATGRNIRLAKIRKNDAELKLELEKNSLYSDIENACFDFNRGKDEYSAAIENLEFNKKSFDAVEKKFEAGLVDVTDYSAAKTNLFRAETEAIRTKLQLLIRKLTIHFYSTGEYEGIINT
ncbi:MAG: TolC family protein [Bacteroidales bacterium]|jgi:outer membrane protein|nr:TolC family protein [Bacteroidales bacterium]